MLSFSLLAIFLPLVAVLAVTARPQRLMQLALLTGALPPGEWGIAGAHLDPLDLALVGLAVSMMMKPGARATRGRIPYLALWITLGITLTIAYLVAPVNAQFLTDPARATYQVLRYCWKPILFYPLAYRLIGSDTKFRTQVANAIVLGAVIISLHASVQGYTLGDPRAYFRGGNSLGGALLVPLTFAVGLCITNRKRSRACAMYFAAALMITRGLLFASSRGASVATAAAICALLGLLGTWQLGRAVVAKIAAIGLVGIVGLFIVDPNFLERPNIAHILTALHPTEDANFQWRTQQRWPVFVAKIKQHPWFGMGTNVDLTLGEQANTPHNGYLSLAVTNGVPATALFVVLGLFGTLNGLRAARRATTVEQRVFAQACIAALFGLFVHNIVESTFTVVDIYNVFWLIIGVTSAMAFATPASAPAAAVARARSRPIRRRPIRIAAQRVT